MTEEKELTWDELPIQVTLQKQRECNKCLCWISAGEVAVVEVEKCAPFLNYTGYTYYFQHFYHLKCWQKKGTS